MSPGRSGTKGRSNRACTSFALPPDFRCTHVAALVYVCILIILFLLIISAVTLLIISALTLLITSILPIISAFDFAGYFGFADYDTSVFA